MSSCPRSISNTKIIHAKQAKKVEDDEVTVSDEVEDIEETHPID